MFSLTKLKTMLIILIFCLSIMACQTRSIQEPTASPEPTLTITPMPTIDYWSSDVTPVSRMDQITGIWVVEVKIGNYYLDIQPDGTFLIATTPEGLTSSSAHTWSMTIENSLITAADYMMCSSDPGMYFASIESDGTLNFTTIQDPCFSRTMLLDKSQQGGFNVHELYYSRVD